MSENTVNVALRRLGFDKDTHTAHGFRSSARTTLAEKLGVAADIIRANLRTRSRVSATHMTGRSLSSNAAR